MSDSSQEPHANVSSTPAEPGKPPYRSRWFLYGSLCTFVGAPLLMMLALLLGAQAPQASKVMEGSGTLLVLIGLALCGYGLVDKYLIHRTLPERPATRVHSAMKTLVVGFLIVAAIGSLISLAVGPQEQETGDPKSAVFTSRDGRYVIEATSRWQENAQLLEEGFAIAASDVTRDIHVAVLVEDKKDFVQPDLRVYADIWGSQTQQLLANPEISPWTESRVNGHAAVLRVARGELNGLRMAYLQTCIETGDHFCAIQAYARRSEFEKSREELETITNTFRLVGQGSE